LAEIAHRLKAKVDEPLVHLTLGGLARDDVQDKLELIAQRLRLAGR
jgi:hypothetical protein